MPKQACFSMRNGTIMGYDERVWKVIDNNTLDRTFLLETIDDEKTGLPRRRKRIRYAPGQEVVVRWIPHDSHRREG